MKRLFSESNSQYRENKHRVVGIDDLPYPPIPPECIDGNEPWPTVIEQDLYPIVPTPRTYSLEWGLRDIASARADLEPHVTPQNEALFRSYHRTLSACDYVEVITERNGNKIWVVDGFRGARLDTHAGGREIHICPQYQTRQMLATNLGPFRDYPMSRVINPRRFLKESDLKHLRMAFPTSIGVRVFFSGFIVVLFNSQKDIVRSWDEGQIIHFGALRVGYDIAVHEMTKTEISTGAVIANNPNNFEQSAAIGLKLRLPGGLECLTVPTHAFVNLYQPKRRPLLRFVEWIAKSKEALRRFAPVKADSSTPAIGIAKKPFTNSPLGHGVWLAGNSTKIGTITVTYDRRISHAVPFPFGFRHDLSLVTDNDLPSMVVPTGTPQVTGWGNYNDVLSGNPVFTTGFNFSTGNTKTISGTGVSPHAQQAIAQGTAYFWDKSSCSQSASILWRTIYDGDSARGLSGMALCLGKPSDQTCLAVCFQNFETPIRRQDLDRDHRGLLDGMVTRLTIKGGFLLPLEIRRAGILIDNAETMAIPGPSTYKGGRSSSDIRRSFSSHN